MVMCSDNNNNKNNNGVDDRDVRMMMIAIVTTSNSNGDGDRIIVLVEHDGILVDAQIQRHSKHPGIRIHKRSAIVTT